MLYTCTAFKSSMEYTNTIETVQLLRTEKNIRTVCSE